MANVYSRSGSLAFGVPTLVSSSLQVTSFDSTRAAQTTEVADRAGEILGVAVFQTNKTEGSLEYVYQGSDLSLASALDVSAIDSSMTGSLLITEVGRKLSNKDFRVGSAKFLIVDGINFNSPLTGSV